MSLDALNCVRAGHGRLLSIKAGLLRQLSANNELTRQVVELRGRVASHGAADLADLAAGLVAAEKRLEQLGRHIRVTLDSVEGVSRG